MLAGAIFDMDGLMFDTESIWQNGWIEMAQRYNYEPSEDFAREISGTSGAIMFSVIHRHYPSVDPEAFYREEREIVDACLKKDVPVKPGLYDILKLFQDRGVRMAVASSSREHIIHQNLEKTNTHSYFRAIVSSKMVERAKPEPDVFLLAAERLGIPIEQCYVFEDSFNGVRAGHASGAYTIMIPDQHQPTDEIRSLADVVCEDLKEAARLMSA